MRRFDGTVKNGAGFIGTVNSGVGLNETVFSGAGFYWNFTDRKRELTLIS